MATSASRYFEDHANAPFITIPRQNHQIDNAVHPFWQTISSDAPIDRYVHSFFHVGNPSLLGKEDLRPIPRRDKVSETRDDWANKIQGNHLITKANISTRGRYSKYIRDAHTSEEKFRLHVPSSNWYKRAIEYGIAQNGAENYPMYKQNRGLGIY